MTSATWSRRSMMSGAAGELHELRGLVMRFDLARSAAVAMVFLGSTLGVGCSSAAQVDEESGASTDPIVDIDSSHVKRQSIGNCWIYATASWAESLVKQAEGTEPNMSESYWTYW